MQIDSGRFRLTPSTSGQFSVRLPANHRRRGLTLAVALALGGTLALGLNSAAVAQRFPATLPLSSLDGTNGFKLDAEFAYDSSGRSVSDAGDVNGDGIDDLIISADGEHPSNNYSGRRYVVFGTRDSFAATLPLSSLNGTNGFKLENEPHTTGSASISAAGDVNSDGIDDLIVGVRDAFPNGVISGRSYVVFGSRGGFAANLPLSSLDGSNGFKLDGEAAGDYFGRSVSDAGDINGDGIDDLIISANRADPNGTYSGRSYVVFGTNDGFKATFAVSSLDGTTGFKIDGEAERDFSGSAVSGAGDVNGDGFDDVIIGANRADPNGTYSGRSYVVFGTSKSFAAPLALSSLDGTNGFKLDGEAAGDYSGFSVSAAGDVNADGIDDLVIGAWRADPNGTFSGRSYVVFGTRDGFAATLPLSSLNGTNGFKLDGGAALDSAGRSVSAAGDVNGDGIDDLIIGAYRAISPGHVTAGPSYVVFGSSEGFPATLPLPSLDGINGFILAGERSGDFSGGSVSAAGDINSDGIDDLIVGASGADINGFDSGRSYVVFGRDVLFADGFE